MADAPKAAPPSGPPDPPPPADQTPPVFIVALQSAIAGSVSQTSYWVGDWTIIVRVATLLDVAQHLRDAPDARFDLCSDVTATDWPPRAERFDLVYCLYSTRHRHRVRVKATAAADQAVASVTGVWPSAPVPSQPTALSAKARQLGVSECCLGLQGASADRQPFRPIRGRLFATRSNTRRPG